MTAVSADFDNDGWPDIHVACDSRPSFLFRNMIRKGRAKWVSKGDPLAQLQFIEALFGLAI